MVHSEKHLEMIYTLYIICCSINLGDKSRILEAYLRDPKRISEISNIFIKRISICFIYDRDYPFLYNDVFTSGNNIKVENGIRKSNILPLIFQSSISRLLMYLVV